MLVHQKHCILFGQTETIAGIFIRMQTLRMVFDLFGPVRRGLPPAVADAVDAARAGGGVKGFLQCMKNLRHLMTRSCHPGRCQRPLPSSTFHPPPTFRTPSVPSLRFKFAPKGTPPSLSFPSRSFDPAPRSESYSSVTDKSECYFLTQRQLSSPCSSLDESRKPETKLKLCDHVGPTVRNRKESMCVERRVEGKR